MTSIADEIEYKLDTVKATPLGPDDIDPTFRSSCIGESPPKIADSEKCH